MAADITNAYNNPRYSTPATRPKVKRVWRRLVYLRALDLLLVADTVESTNAAVREEVCCCTRSTAWRSAARSRRSTQANPCTGTWIQAKIVVDERDPPDKYQTTFDLRRGYAALLREDAVSGAASATAGRGPGAGRYRPRRLYEPGRNAGHFHRHIKDFWVKDFSEGVIPEPQVLQLGRRAAHRDGCGKYFPFGPGYGRWRLELEPEKPAATDYFLNVMRPTLDKAETLPAVRRTETAEA